jgi:hypothetical protein
MVHSSLSMGLWWNNTDRENWSIGIKLEYWNKTGVL